METEKLAALLPRRLRALLPAGDNALWEELRLRAGRPAALNIGGREYALTGTPVTTEELGDVLERASGFSFQTAQSQLLHGYITAPGGFRVGACGTAVVREGKTAGLRDITSVCIRIPCAHRGCADDVFSCLARDGFPSALIVSPPGMGKTTLLRELIRLASENGRRVSVADERMELSDGFDLGPCTDVMRGMSKGKAVMQMLRSMSPSVLAVDEISCPEDAAALLTAADCGVTLLATVHGDGEESLGRRPALGKLINRGVFQRVVGVTRKGDQRVYEVSRL